MDLETRQHIAYFCAGAVDVTLRYITGDPMFGPIGVSLMVTAICLYLLRKINDWKKSPTEWLVSKYEIMHEMSDAKAI